MKQLFLAVLACAALASCQKDGDIPAGKTASSQPLQLQLEASLDNSAPQVPRGFDLKIESDKAKILFDGKDKLKVYTSVWINRNDPARTFYPQTGTCIAEGTLEWKLKDKKLSFQGTVPFKPGKSIDDFVAGNTTVWCQIISDEANPTRLSPQLQFQQVATGDRVNLDFPIVLDAKLDRSADDYMNNFTRPDSEKKFKPRGQILRLTVENKTGIDVQVHQFANHNLQIQESSSATRQGYLSTGSTNNIYGDINPWITLSNNEVSSKTLLLWVPNAGATRGMSAQLRVRIDPNEERPVYSKIIRDENKTYKEGAVYNATIQLRVMPNPITLISPYALYKDGTRFLDDINDFAPGDPTKNKDVGYFSGDELKAIYEAGPKTYPNGGAARWRLATSAFEFGTLFPMGMNLSQPHMRWLQDIEIEAYQVKTVEDAYVDAANKAIYALRFGNTYFQNSLNTNPSEGLGNNLEQWDNNLRHAFYYQFDDVRKVLTIKAKYIGNKASYTSGLSARDISDGGLIDWSSITEKIEIPFYGESNGANIGNALTLWTHYVPEQNWGFVYHPKEYHRWEWTVNNPQPWDPYTGLASRSNVDLGGDGGRKYAIYLIKDLD